MLLDIPTLSIVTVFVTAVLGALLVFAGLQNSDVRAPTLWGAAFIIAGVGIALVTLRGTIPDWMSINAANALVLFSYSLLWAGARNFGGRRSRPVAMLVPVLLWLAACATPLFAGDINLRVVLVSGLMAALSAAAAAEFWRDRAEPLMSRWPTMCVLLFNAVVLIGRIPLTLLSPLQGQSWIHGTAFAVMAFATLLFAVVLAFLLLNMIKERTELTHKIASLIDPLCGVANRRAFIDDATRRLARPRSASASAILLFDLDHFKWVNDRLGHATGDIVLRLFARVATETLAPDVLFGRIGGEEFAAMAQVDDIGEAAAIAERVRRHFVMAAAGHAAGTLAPSVSIGVTLAPALPVPITDLLAAADQALYRAKANGRNRVECNVPAPGLAPLAPVAERDAAGPWPGGKAPAVA